MLLEEWEAQRAWVNTQVFTSNTSQHECRKRLAGFEPHFKEAQRQINETFKLAQRNIENAEKTLLARRTSGWDGATLRKTMEIWDAVREEALEALRETLYFLHQADWLQERFPEAQYADVAGLSKVVTLEEIEAKDSSLTPGRYVGVGRTFEDEEDNFIERMTEIHVELADLNLEADRFAEIILKNFKSLGL